ncbi:MAG: PPOX class F420-dependent oxidoreductase [Actinomycetota bacterium]
MDFKVRRFLESNHAAVMTTLKADGTPHVARVGVGLVDGKLWSSGTETRLRTGHIRRDPRCALAVLDYSNAYRWMGLETRVTIRPKETAVDDNLALYRVLAGEPDDLERYREAMVEEQRLIYEFTVERAYGDF